MNQVNGSLVERDDLDGDAERAFEVRLEVERKPFEGHRGIFSVEDPEIDVALGPRRPTRTAPVEVHRDDTGGPPLDEGAQTRFVFFLGHGAIMGSLAFPYPTLFSSTGPGRAR